MYKAKVLCSLILGLQLAACTQQKQNAETKDPAMTEAEANALKANQDLLEQKQLLDFAERTKSQISKKLKDDDVKKNQSLENKIDQDIVEYYEKNCKPLEGLMKPLSYKVGDEKGKAEFYRKKEMRRTWSVQCRLGELQLLNKYGKLGPNGKKIILQKNDAKTKEWIKTGKRLGSTEVSAADTRIINAGEQLVKLPQSTATAASGCGENQEMHCGQCYDSGEDSIQDEVACGQTMKAGFKETYKYTEEKYNYVKTDGGRAEKCVVIALSHEIDSYDKDMFEKKCPTPSGGTTDACKTVALGLYKLNEQTYEKTAKGQLKYSGGDSGIDNADEDSIKQTKETSVKIPATCDHGFETKFEIKDFPNLGNTNIYKAEDEQ